jgi:hypothetical protein
MFLTKHLDLFVAQLAEVLLSILLEAQLMLLLLLRQLWPRHTRRSTGKLSDNRPE